MEFSEYQRGTAKTAIYGDSIAEMIRETTNARYINCGLSLILRLAYVSNGLGEIGEVQGKVKKIIRDSGGKITDEHCQAIGKELGDCLWYISQMATELGLDLDRVASQNLAKLASRKERGTLQGSGDDR